MWLKQLTTKRLTLRVTSPRRNKFIIIIMMKNTRLRVLVAAVGVDRLARDKEEVVEVVDALVAVRPPAHAPTVLTPITVSTVAAALLLRTAGATVGAGAIDAAEVLGNKPTRLTMILMRPKIMRCLMSKTNINLREQNIYIFIVVCR
jgi:hypothetical protein